MTARYLACEKCGAKMKRVNDTRQGIISIGGVEMGVNWRKRKCECGHEALSIEVLQSSLPFEVNHISGFGGARRDVIPESEFIECIKQCVTASEAARKLGSTRANVANRARLLGFKFDVSRLTKDQRADVSYMVKKGGFSREDAIRSILQPKAKMRAA